jgi:hypothetical protein
MQVVSVVPSGAQVPCLVSIIVKLIKLLSMKTKKSAAVAALKTTEKTTTTSAPAAKSITVAPASTVPSTGANGAKAVSTAPAVIQSTPKAASSAPKSASGALTTIDVKVDVGFGNAVYLRGQGSGLTWEHGVPLACVDGGTWRWSQSVSSPITFKVLINDQVWAAGNDLVVAPGQKLEVAPRFA